MFHQINALLGNMYISSTHVVFFYEGRSGSVNANALVGVDWSIAVERVAMNER